MNKPSPFGCGLSVNDVMISTFRLFSVPLSAEMVAYEEDRRREEQREQVTNERRRVRRRERDRIERLRRHADRVSWLQSAGYDPPPDYSSMPMCHIEERGRLAGERFEHERFRAVFEAM